MYKFKLCQKLDLQLQYFHSSWNGQCKFLLISSIRNIYLILICCIFWPSLSWLTASGITLYITFCLHLNISTSTIFMLTEYKVLTYFSDFYHTIATIFTSKLFFSCLFQQKLQYIFILVIYSELNHANEYKFNHFMYWKKIRK